MPVASIELYENDDSTSAGVQAFGTVANGAESSAWEIHVWNSLDDATADTAKDVKLAFEASTDGGTTWSATHTAITSGWVRARVNGTTNGSSNTATTQTTSYRPVTGSQPLLLDNIPGDCARHVFVKVAMPNGAVGSSEVRLHCYVDWAEPSTTSGVGHYETGGNGVFTFAGDQSGTDIYEGGTLAESGTPDTYVQVSDNTIWRHNGIPYVKLAHQIELTNTDGSAATLASGEEYIATISVGASSTFTVTKSNKGTAPLAESNRPAVPSGERLIGYVKRHFDATIETADIDQADIAYGWFYLETSAFTATIHRGTAMVDNSLVRWTSSRTVTISASETNTIYIQPDGTLENVTSGNSPTNGRSLAIWEVTTDGSGETARRDLRLWIGPRQHRIDIHEDGNITTNDERYAMLPTVRDCYFLMPTPMYFALGDTGTTSGNNIMDIEYSDAGGAWTTVFTSSGSDDERPTIAFDASDPIDRGALPEVVVIPGGSRLRMVVDGTAGGSPADAEMVLFLEEAGR